MERYFASTKNGDTILRDWLSKVEPNSVLQYQGPLFGAVRTTSLRAAQSPELVTMRRYEKAPKGPATLLVWHSGASCPKFTVFVVVTGALGIICPGGGA